MALFDFLIPGYDTFDPFGSDKSGERPYRSVFFVGLGGQALSRDFDSVDMNAVMLIELIYQLNSTGIL